LLEQCHFPSDVIESCVDDNFSEEDPDNIFELRESQGTQDLFSLCFTSLGSTPFFHCLTLLSYPHIQPSLAEHPLNPLCENALARYPPSLSSLDAALHTHLLAVPHIKAAHKHLLVSATLDSVALYPVVMISDLLQLILCHPHQSHFPLLLHITCCKLLGGCVFLLGPPPSAPNGSHFTLSLPSPCGVLETPTGPQSLSELFKKCFLLLTSAIEYLFLCLEQSITSGSLLLRNTASQALFRLFTHAFSPFCGTQLSCEAPQLPLEYHHAIIHKFAHLIDSFVQHSISSPVLIQTVSQHIARYSSSDLAGSYMTIIAEKIQTLLQSELQEQASGSSSSPPRWFLSPNRTTLLLEMISQLIRYSTSTSSDSNGSPVSPLELFLSHCWGSVEHISTTALQSNFPYSEVLDGVMSIYQEGLRAAPALFLRMEIAQTIASASIGTACGNKSLPSGLVTVRCLVEAASAPQFQSSSDSLPHDQLLSEIFVHLMDATMLSFSASASSSVSPQDLSSLWLWAEDPEAIEAFFAFLLQYFRSCPHLIYRLSQANHDLPPQLLEISLRYLSVTKETEPLRKILQLCHAIFSPQITSAAVAASSELRSLHLSVIFTPILSSLPTLLTTLLSLLSSEGTQSIWPTLHEVLYAITALCCEYNHLTSLSHSLRICLCLETTAAEESQLSSLRINEFLSPEDRQLVLHTLLQLGEQKNNRRFKALVMDIGKICNRELDREVLQDYLI
jgi:hypothetical protein